MSKSKLAFFPILATCILMLLPTTIIPQVQFMKEPGRTKYTNNPCSSPEISFVLWDESFQERRPAGGVDCNASNYGKWKDVIELKNNLKTYRYQQGLDKNGIRVVGSVVGRDGNSYVVLKKDSAYIGINIGVVGTAGGSVVAHDGGTLVSTNGGNVIAQGGGNFVTAAAVIAQGGGNLIGHDGASVIAQGGGNVVSQGGGSWSGRLLSAGDTLFRLPNRYVVVAGPKQQAPTPPPAKPPAPVGSSSGGGDAQTRILLCVNSSNSMLRQIIAKDGGANHISFTQGNNQAAIFRGNVLTLAYRDALVNAARSCGASSVDTSGLRIGR